MFLLLTLNKYMLAGKVIFKTNWSDEDFNEVWPNTTL